MSAEGWAVGERVIFAVFDVGVGVIASRARRSMVENGGNPGYDGGGKRWVRGQLH